MLDLDIVAPQAERGAFDESRLLAGGLDQRKTALRIDDGQRQARKARAGADVGDAAAAQVGLQSQTVEDMFAQHPQPVADCRQIELRVADFKFVHELEQRLAARDLQGDADVARPRDEQLLFGLSRHGRAAQGLGALSKTMDKTASV